MTDDTMPTSEPRSPLGPYSRISFFFSDCVMRALPLADARIKPPALGEVAPSSATEVATLI